MFKYNSVQEVFIIIPSSHTIPVLEI